MQNSKCHSNPQSVASRAKELCGHTTPTAGCMVQKQTFQSETKPSYPNLSCCFISLSSGLFWIQVLVITSIFHFSINSHLFCFYFWVTNSPTIPNHEFSRLLLALVREECRSHWYTSTTHRAGVETFLEILRTGSLQTYHLPENVFRSHPTRYNRSMVHDCLFTSSFWIHVFSKQFRVFPSPERLGPSFHASRVAAFLVVHLFVSVLNIQVTVG